MFLSSFRVFIGVVIFILEQSTVSNGHFQDDGFDFIIVGAGPAGCTIANRLSEDGRFTVLLLEAGQVPDPTLHIPALSANVTFGGPNGDFIKAYSTVPQKHMGLDSGGVVAYWVGEVLGGGSSVNMMGFTRGSPFDYDSWSRQAKDISWSYKHMLRHFRRMEDYQGDFPSDYHHGTGGPITVSRPRYQPGLNFWLEAGRYLGYPSGVDQNGPQQISFTSVESNKRFGRRVSAFTGHIKPFLETRSNLVVVVGAKVSKVLIDGGRAVGVVYRATSDGSVHTVRGRREIILSAGALSSPAILMRSGVGSEDVLREAGIAPVKVLPVGKNLQDHVVVRLDFVVNNTYIFDPRRDLNQGTWNLYNTVGDGPYSAAGPTGQLFLRSPMSSFLQSLEVEPHESGQWPNVQSVLVFGGLGNPLYEPPSVDLEMADWEGAIIVTPFLTRPKSVGTLRLNPSDVEGDPLLDFQYLSHPQDVEDLIYIIKFSLDVMEKTPSFRRIGARYAPNPLPACRHLNFRSDEYWRCFVRQMGKSGFHASGTCRMGRGSSDPETVVDSQLRVLGIRNLRVADTSIAPNVVNANTQVSAFVIGEKAAEMILKSHTRD